MGTSATPAAAGVVPTIPTYNFNINGTYSTQTDPQYSGTLSVFDNSVTSVDINIGGFGPFNTIQFQGSDPVDLSDYELVLVNGSNAVNELYLIIDTSATLFAGLTSQVDPASVVLDDNGLPLTSSITGSLTAETPIPAALPLFAGGLGLMGFLGRRRKRKVALTAA